MARRGKIAFSTLLLMILLAPAPAALADPTGESDPTTEELSVADGTSETAQQKPKQNSTEPPKPGDTYKKSLAECDIAKFCGWSTCPEGQLPYRTVTFVRDAKNKETITEVGVANCQVPPPTDIRARAIVEFFKYKPDVPVPSIQPPDGQTLANFPTIFSSTVNSTDIPLTLLGQKITLRVIPTNYHWTFGDGATLDTPYPGRPYPDADITHRYKDGGKFEVAVAITFRGEFNVNGGPFQRIDGAITRQSPATSLVVRTARAELVKPPS